MIKEVERRIREYREMKRRAGIYCLVVFITVIFILLFVWEIFG
jgi:hypothetical protein